jgi:protein-S-isoprenylcysteine O-methyltransferase Ste14
MTAKSLVVFVVLLAVFAAAAVLAVPGPWTNLRIAGVLLGVPCMALAFLAQYQLGKSFSITPQARELVTHGLYSRIRNPKYVFGLLGLLGLILYFQRLQWLWVFLLLVPLQFFRARKEAEVLSAKFGEAYLEYRRKTWF